ncbi:hypothetical protein DFH09DRAFT_1109716 [Mycena vulgaris]|nr:hypothetical protein DFH09DRAFT_1109716 [Mycena vulgaris]
MESVMASVNALEIKCHEPTPAGLAPSDTTTVLTRSIVLAMLKAIKWPSVKFDIFWRLPGFDLREEFGPLATYHPDQNQVEWHVTKMHAIPVIGPENDSSTENEASILPPAFSVAGGGPPILHTVAPAPAPPPSGGVVSTTPVMPVVLVTQAGQNTFVINDQMITWLVSSYAYFPLVAEVHTTNKRHQQTITKLLEWVHQVFGIKAVHSRVHEEANNLQGGKDPRAVALRSSSTKLF